MNWLLAVGCWLLAVGCWNIPCGCCARSALGIFWHLRSLAPTRCCSASCGVPRKRPAGGARRVVEQPHRQLPRGLPQQELARQPQQQPGFSCGVLPHPRAQRRHPVAGLARAAMRIGHGRCAEPVSLGMARVGPVPVQAGAPIETGRASGACTPAWPTFLRAALSARRRGPLLPGVRPWARSCASHRSSGRVHRSTRSHVETARC